MAHIHEIGIAAETREFDRGIRSGVIRPAEDAVKAFGKLSDAIEEPDHSNVLSDLEGDLKDVGTAADRAGRDSEKGIDKLEDALRDAQRESEKLDKKLDDVGTHGRSGMDRVKEGANELQSEIGQNLGETVSSFRGDLSDLGQVGQDTLGGLAATVSSMGPAGIAGAFALAAGAAGLGAFTAAQEDARARQEKLNEEAAKFADGYLSGINGAIDAAQVFAEINAIATDPDRYKTASDNAKNWGVDVSTAMRAMAGDATALGTVDSALDRQADALERNASGADNYAQNIEAATTGQSSANNSYLDGRRALDELNNAMELGRQQANNAQRALYDYAEQVGVSTGKTDDLGNAIVQLPGGKEIVMNAQTKAASEDVDAFERRVQGVQDKTVKLHVDDSELRYYERNTTLKIAGVIIPNGGYITGSGRTEQH